jgi:hypothetical protein
MLDFDATDDPVRGHQEGRSSHGYHDHHCSLPLHVFCGHELRAAYPRPANIDAARHARAVLKLLVDRLRAAWPAVEITIRAAGGFCRRRAMRWCDRNGIGSVPGLARNRALQRLAADRTDRGERQSQRTGEPQRAFGSFAYAAGSWDRPRRVILKAEPGARGADPRFIVADVPGDPQGPYDAVYCRRGEAEDRIKGPQLDLFAGRTSCHRLPADQSRRRLSSAASVLIQASRRVAGRWPAPSRPRPRSGRSA